MRAQRRHRPVNQRPKSADSLGQQSRIFVLRLHDDAIPFKALEVLGQCQRNSRPATGKRCVDNGVLLQLRNIRDARIFNAPKLFRIIARIGRHRWLSDRYASCRCRLPSAPRTSGTSPRRSSTRQSSSVSPSASFTAAGIEYAVDWIRPVLLSQNRIAFIAREQGKSRMLYSTVHVGGIPSLRIQQVSHWYSRMRYSFPDAVPVRLSLWPYCISSRAIRNESVDSAPWFSLMRSG